MKWLLIMWVMWGDGVITKQLEYQYDTEQSCLDAMELVVDQYKAIEEPKYGYTLQCRPSTAEADF